MAVTDPQKANLLANTIKNNFIENNRMQDNYDQDDEVVTSTVNTFLSSPPSTQIEPAMPDEIINFIKNTSSKKAPADMYSDGRSPVPKVTTAVCTLALFTGNGFKRNVGVPQVNGLYGGRSCILTQLVAQSEL
ncbi:hypothetical protein TNCV_2891961 [Trichonephila clavipes]|nr:hypothetical protein TNCV_2891961 [Trichonephila clavipes]